MRFYNNQHQFYIGIDLHAIRNRSINVESNFVEKPNKCIAFYFYRLFYKSMYICVINNSGETVFHKNMECSRDNLELVTNTFGKDIVVGVECILTWYWVADFCAERVFEKNSVRGCP